MLRVRPDPFVDVRFFNAPEGCDVKTCSPVFGQRVRVSVKVDR